MKELKAEIEAFREQIKRTAREYGAYDALVVPLSQIGATYLDLYERSKALEVKLARERDAKGTVESAGLKAADAEICRLRQQLSDLQEVHDKLLPLRDREIRELTRAAEMQTVIVKNLGDELTEQKSKSVGVLRPLLQLPGAFLGAFGVPAYQAVKEFFMQCGGAAEDCPPPPKPEKK